MSGLQGKLSTQPRTAHLSLNWLAKRLVPQPLLTCTVSMPSIIVCTLVYPLALVNLDVVLRHGVATEADKPLDLG